MRIRRQDRSLRAAALALAVLAIALVPASCGRAAPPTAAPAQPPDRSDDHGQGEDWLNKTFEEDGEERSGITPPRPAADEERAEPPPPSPDGRRR